MSAWQRAANWTLLYVLRPLGQIALFIVLSALIMSALALTIGFVLRTPWHGISALKTYPNIDLLRQVITQLPNMLVDGITIGFVYAMIALGYTLVYGVLKFVNFAHSEVFMVGGVVGYEVMQFFSSAKQLQTMSPVLLILAMLLTSMVICGLLAVAIERLAYKPLRNAPRLVPLISAIGVSFFLQDFVRAIEALARNQFNLSYPTSDVPLLSNVRFPLINTQILWNGEMVPVATSINMNSVIVIISAILMLIGLNYFVNGTKLGKGIRAVSQDQGTASLMGINVNLMISLTFLVGGALGGAAGVLFGLKTGKITPYIGFIPGLKAFTAAVLGGIGNVTGALLGGILLGLLEAFFSSLLPYFPALGSGYSDIFAFAILILILIFRPAGLLGKKVDEKV
ncbi:MAG: branched-chain amino acid ABC transporter permease [Chloroflexota bacterium]